MTKIRSGKTTTGLPGFKRNTTISSDTGKRVNRTKASGTGVRRLIAANPADGNSANIGTNKDVAILGTVVPAVSASLQTALAGNNNDLKYEARTSGTYGNGITVAYTTSGTEGRAGPVVSVIVKAITVALGLNEKQIVTINAGGGTFKLTFSGQQTAAIVYNATATAVQTALEALSNIAPGDVLVSGANGGPYTVTFLATYAKTNVAAMTTDATSLTGGAGTAVVTQGTPAIADTAAQISAAIEASAAADALVTVENKTGNDGTGVVTALAPTNLAGGLEAVTTPDGAVNTVGQQSPGRVRSPNFKKGNATPTGQMKIAPGRSTNRGIRATKNN